eukprot:2566730-Alexandrium_andersonii.AAC.1
MSPSSSAPSAPSAAPSPGSRCSEGAPALVPEARGANTLSMASPIRCSRAAGKKVAAKPTP